MKCGRIGCTYPAGFEIRHPYARCVLLRCLLHLAQTVDAANVGLPSTGPFARVTDVRPFAASAAA